ncbi:methionyl-tRNA formyltransferase [uncultured Helicobacter sp.]|uniref:methionyl-tRNA formyltransferase n=1 Tax=uncultured Helicobacter sp. TaxID=175537 RepID=UPI002622469C|nr:methionyl-tRNA formyltransferase [uncultured Helicobacter sp.]
MRVIFMGTPDYAAMILQSLLKYHQVCALVCQEDKRAGRNMRLQMPATKKLLLERDSRIPIFQPTKLDDNFVKKLKQIPCDRIIVAAYGKILPKSILEIATCINLHASILPQFRGASPIQQSILKDEKYFGVTAMKMNEGLDCGDILGFKVIRNQFQSQTELFSKLAKMAANLTIEYLERCDFILPLKQIEADVSYCKKIKKEFGQVCFDDAISLVKKARAYEGWPEIYLKNGLKLKGVKMAESVSQNPAGEILYITKEQIKIGCKNGSVWIESLQAPSKKAMSAYQYLQGKRLKLGDILE